MRERTTHERGAVSHRASRERPQGLRISHCGRLRAASRERVPYAAFSVRVSLAEIEPVGFRTKNELRNHQAIVQPRLYDGLMVTQIILHKAAWATSKVSTGLNLATVE